MNCNCIKIFFTFRIKKGNKANPKPTPLISQPQKSPTKFKEDFKNKIQEDYESKIKSYEKIKSNGKQPELPKSPTLIKNPSFSNNNQLSKSPTLNKNPLFSNNNQFNYINPIIKQTETKKNEQEILKKRSFELNTAEKEANKLIIMEKEKERIKTPIFDKFAFVKNKENNQNHGNYNYLKNNHLIKFNNDENEFYIPPQERISVYIKKKIGWIGGIITFIAFIHLFLLIRHLLNEDNKFFCDSNLHEYSRNEDCRECPKDGYCKNGILVKI